VNISSGTGSPSCPGQNPESCKMVVYVLYVTLITTYLVEVYAFLFSRYSGPLLDEGQFSAAVDSTAVTRDFSKLVEWIVTELAAVDKLEEHVHSIDSRWTSVSTDNMFHVVIKLQMQN